MKSLALASVAARSTCREFDCDIDGRIQRMDTLTLHTTGHDRDDARLCCACPSGSVVVANEDGMLDVALGCAPRCDMVRNVTPTLPFPCAEGARLRREPSSNAAEVLWREPKKDLTLS